MRELINKHKTLLCIVAAVSVIAVSFIFLIPIFTANKEVPAEPDEQISNLKNLNSVNVPAQVDAEKLSVNTSEGGMLVTFFGNGELGKIDGTAEETRFSLPHGLCFDNSNNLLVFDTFNSSIRQLSSLSSQTILGFMETLDDYGFIFPAYLDGLRADALFGRPTDGVSAPNGDLFIVDGPNHAIRLLRDGRVYTFVGGVRGFTNGVMGAARFDNPTAIDIDGDGNLYVTDTLNNAIRKITPDGMVSTIAGSSSGASGNQDGSASQARFNDPSGIAVDSNGVIYVADTGNNVIRKIENGRVSTITEEGELDSPIGLCWANGVLFIADSGSHTIKAITRSGNVITVAGSGEPGDEDAVSNEAMMNRPSGIVYRNGVLYIADTFNNKIKSVSIDAGSEVFS